MSKFYKPRGTKQEQQAKKRHFQGSPEHKHMRQQEVVERYGIATKTAYEWRREMGWIVKHWCSDAAKRMMRDIQFGTAGEVAPVPARILAKRCGVSEATVCHWRTQKGVLPYQQNPSPERPPVLSLHINRRPPFTKTQRKMMKTIKSWPRPKGVHEHVQCILSQRPKLVDHWRANSEHGPR